MKKLFRFMISMVLIVCMSVPCFAGMYNNSCKSSKKYRVTCNHHYDNKYNTLAKADSVAEAKKKIGKQPKAYRGQWYVYDDIEEKIVWPDLSTDKKKVRKIVEWEVAVANDPRHGYDTEGERVDGKGWKLKWKRWGKCGDFGCSTLVATAYELFGFFSMRQYAREHNLKMRYSNASFTIHGFNANNMVACCRGTEKFKDMTSQYAKKGKSMLKAGDVVVNSSQTHAAIVVSGHRIVEGISNENKSEFGYSKPGDQRGGYEVSIHSLNGYDIDRGIRYVFRPVV